MDALKIKALKEKIVENRTLFEHSCGVNVLWECWDYTEDDKKLARLLDDGYNEGDIIKLMTNEWKPAIP